MRLIKKILVVFVAVIIVLQFIRPGLNKSNQVLTTDITKVVTIHDTVLTLVKNACYDCHSNNTVYPWYSHIQPMGWLVAYDIKQARNELNFSEFGSYSQRRQLSKLEGIANSIKDDVMPLNSYKIMHKSAQLSSYEKSLIINWAHQSIDKLSVSNFKYKNGTSTSIDLKDKEDNEDIGFQTISIPHYDVSRKISLFSGCDAVAFYCRSGSISTNVINYLQKLHKLENLYSLVI